MCGRVIREGECDSNKNELFMYMKLSKEKCNQ